MGNRNPSHPHSDELPEFVLFTNPGCDSPRHRARILQLVQTMAVVPGYKPDREVMSCGCLLETISWPTRSEAEGRQ